MINAAYCGKKRRLEKIVNNGRTLIVPVDDSLIFGPFDGLENIHATIGSIVDASPSAMLGYKGSYSLLLETEKGNNIPYILNITASTTTGRHIQKIKSCTVREALIMGADCVAVHVNYTSNYENEMLYNLANAITEADEYGLPVLAISYPRRTHDDGTDDNYENEKKEDIDSYTKKVCRCVRASVELGADIIKTQYTGSRETFEKVVASGMGRPVVIAGGPVITVEESYKMARDAIDAGAAGISYGRNIFDAEDIKAYMAGMKKIVFEDATVENALKIYKEVHKDV